MMPPLSFATLFAAGALSVLVALFGLLLRWDGRRPLGAMWAIAPTMISGLRAWADGHQARPVGLATASAAPGGALVTGSAVVEAAAVEIVDRTEAPDCATSSVHGRVSIRRPGSRAR